MQDAPLSAAGEREAPKTEVFDLVEFDLAARSTTWKLADVRANKAGKKPGQGLNKRERERREVLPFDRLLRVNLFIDL